MTQSSEILIVGGGIGGLAAALACARAGREVCVLERAEQFSEVGAGLQLGPNGAEALRALGVLDTLDDLAVFPAQIVMHDINNGAELSRIDLGQTLQSRFGHRYRVMHRSDLLDALLNAVRAEPKVMLETDQHVTGADIASGGSTVTCANGNRFSGRILIAADGVNSVLRPMINGPDDLLCEGYVAYRGTVPFAELPEHSGEDTVVLHTGDGCHLVQYPVRGGQLYNQVAVFRSDRYRPGIPDADWATPDELDAAFAKTMPYVKASITRIDRQFRWPLKDRDPIQTWVRDSAALIGDAAHPMYQYLAQGACQALEDAVAIGACLGADLSPKALQRYADVRRARTANVQTKARKFGEFIHLGGMAASLRDELLKSHSPSDYSQMEWIWEWDKPSWLSGPDATTQHMEATR
ncbi:MAG: FAD-dependent monooxygenase [Pseudomonadota bacterium]|nr:FAD-dependent monooxygenase [Pseudomonadota bacterium]